MWKYEDYRLIGDIQLYTKCSSMYWCRGNNGSMTQSERTTQICWKSSPVQKTPFHDTEYVEPHL